jgi:hypothetical protein
VIVGAHGGELLGGAVVLARLLLPLTILRWPLPGIVLSAAVEMDRLRMRGPGSS